LPIRVNRGKPRDTKPRPKPIFPREAIKKGVSVERDRYGSQVADISGKDQTNKGLPYAVIALSAD